MNKKIYINQNNSGDNMIFKIAFRAVFFYFTIIFAYKIMGKRELGELSLVDFVISTVLSQMIAISIENYKEWIFIMCIILDRFFKVLDRFIMCTI